DEGRDALAIDDDRLAEDPAVAVRDDEGAGDRRSLGDDGVLERLALQRSVAAEEIGMEQHAALLVEHQGGGERARLAALDDGIWLLDADRLEARPPSLAAGRAQALEVLLQIRFLARLEPVLDRAIGGQQGRR